MFIRNTSRYPDAEVKALVKFATKQFPLTDLTKVCINVRNLTKGDIAGRAYSSVPRDYSNAPKTAKHLVVLRIGPESKFPSDNTGRSARWVRITHEEYKEMEAAGKAYLTRGVGKMQNGVEENWMEKWEKSPLPYGGKQSVTIEYHNWREGLVGLAAHELNHIRQFQNKVPCSESRCEKKALEVLGLYRASLIADSGVELTLGANV